MFNFIHVPPLTTTFPIYIQYYVTDVSSAPLFCFSPSFPSVLSWLNTNMSDQIQIFSEGNYYIISVSDNKLSVSSTKCAAQQPVRLDSSVVNLFLP